MFGIYQQAIGTGKKLEGFCRGMYGGPIWAPYRHSPAYFVHSPASEMIAWLIDAGTRQF